METIRQSLFLMAAQIIVAAALSGSYAMAWVRRKGTRAQRATWFRAARAMLRLTPLAVALFLAGVAWALWAELEAPNFGLVWWVGATIPLTVGLRWMQRAGALQSRARLVPCRRLARLAGWFASAGALLGVIALFTVPVAQWSGGHRLAVAAALAVVGFSGLLGGLSGKPRPAAGFGTFLWLLTWLFVIHQTLP